MLDPVSGTSGTSGFKFLEQLRQRSSLIALVDCPNSVPLATITFESMINDVQTWVTRKQAALLPIGSLRGRLVLGSFWSLTGTLVPQGLQLIATVIVARWLGKADYGQIGIIRNTVGMLGVFVGLGLGLTATKYVAEFRQQDPVRAGRIASLTMTVAAISGAVITTGLILGAPWLASHTLASPALAGPLAIGAGLLLLGELNGVQACILAGLEAFGALARVSLLAGLFSFPTIVAGAWFWGVKGVVAGQVAALAVNCSLNHLVLRREAAQARMRILLAGGWEERRVLWIFALPAFLSSVVVTPVSWLCSALLVNTRNGYAEMGLFSVADQWRTAVLFVPGIISRVILPILSSYSRESSESDTPFSQTLEAGFAAGILVAFPLITILSFGGGLIAKAYGPEFAEMRYPLAGLLYTAGALAIGSPVGLAVQAKGAMWLAFLNNLAWSIMLLVSFHFLISLGAMGLSLAYSVSYLMLSLTFLWIFCRKRYFPWSLGLRTGLADVSLVVFAFLPLFLPGNLSLGLTLAALPMALIAVWAFLPRSLGGRLVQALGPVLWSRSG